MKIYLISILAALYVLTANLYARKGVSEFEEQYNKHAHEGGLFSSKKFIYALSLLLIPVVSVLSEIRATLKNRDSLYATMFAVIMALFGFVVFKI